MKVPLNPSLTLASTYLKNGAWKHASVKTLSTAQTTARMGFLENRSFFLSAMQHYLGANLYSTTAMMA